MKPRVKEIIERCNGSILDLGCVQHTLKGIESDSWLHGKLTERFSYVIGIDILKEEVLELKKREYNVICADVENFKLNENFDTIVAGELIEHLSNPGNFLDSCHNHLKKDGKLILTTPNSFWIENTIRKIFGKLHINIEHTAWYDDIVLTQLAERHRFEVIEIKYIIERFNPSSITGYIWHKIIYPILLIMLPKGFTSRYLLFVLKKSMNSDESN